MLPPHPDTCSQQSCAAGATTSRVQPCSQQHPCFAAAGVVTAAAGAQSGDPPPGCGLGGVPSRSMSAGPRQRESSRPVLLRFGHRQALAAGEEAREPCGGEKRRRAVAHRLALAERGPL
ncbi:MAG: hypothetical protein WDW36_003847 [Sanguina aurantia]